MNKEKTFIESSVRVVLSGTEGITKIDAIWVKSNNSDHLEKTIRTETGSLNEAGVRIQTQAFVQGITAAIHEAHQRGVWDSADHLRYIIEELEKGFVRVSDITHHPLSEFGN